jgi:hypothetical protein
MIVLRVQGEDQFGSMLGGRGGVCAALLAVGYQQHKRGEWRKKRGNRKRTEISTRLPDPTNLYGSRIGWEPGRS